MKNLFLFLVLIFIISNSSAQFDSSWNNTNGECKSCDSVKNFSLSMFIYKNVRYPIVDSVLYKKYGGEKYSESFYFPVLVDSGITHIFSAFLLKDQTVVNYKKIINGQLKNETEYKNPQKTWRSWVVFFLFFILLPILFYCFKYVDSPGFNLIRDKRGDEKGNWNYFSLLILIGPMLMFALSYVVLLFLQKTIYIHYLPFLSSTLYYCCTSVICLIIAYMIWLLNSFKGLIIFPLIMAQACIAGLLGGVYTKEINIVSLVLVMLLLVSVPDFINGFIFGVVKTFQRLRK